MGKILLLATLLIAGSAMASDITFNIDICNSSSVCTTGTTIGTIDITQNANSLHFDLNFLKIGDIQYALGSQGGGDTLGMQLINFTPLSSLTATNFSGTFYGGAAAPTTGWTTDPTGTHLDGFGNWNFGINNAALNTGTPTSSLVSLHFDLNGSGLTLANLTYNSPDSNCDNANPSLQCYFAMHVNDIYDVPVGQGTQNVATGYAGATLGERQPPPTVPEPATLLMLGSGLLGMSRWVRRKL